MFLNREQYLQIQEWRFQEWDQNEIRKAQCRKLELEKSMETWAFYAI